MTNDQDEIIIPLVGGTEQIHTDNKHPRIAPCRSYGLLDDYDEVERVYRQEPGY